MTAKDLAEVYRLLSPPRELLAYLDKAIAAQGDKTPQPIRAYRELWRKIIAGEPIPELDRYDQPALITTPIKYE